MGCQILQGDSREVLRSLPASSVHLCVTSPPYFGLRDYEHPGQLGQEEQVEDYVANLVEVFREVRRVLRPDGTLWLNLGDSFHNQRTHNGGGVPTNTVHRGGKREGKENHVRTNRSVKQHGLKDKDLIGVPWRVAFALQADGWWLRCDVVWSKPNPMPESMEDRPARSHEYVFLFSPSPSYYYDHIAVKEPHTSADRPPGNKSALIKGRLSPSYTRPTKQKAFPAGGRNRRSVWSIATKNYRGAHFATFPPDLVAPCIQAGVSEWGCCGRCGAPYARVTEEGDPLPGQENGETLTGSLFDSEEVAPSEEEKVVLREIVTVGWESTCGCWPGEVTRSVVLDPFFGSGTVGEVASRFGCDCIGIELNPEYVALARKRNAQGGLGI